MLKQVKQIVATCVMAMAVAVISLPVESFSATSPTVTVLNPLQKGLLSPGKLALDKVGNIYVADVRARAIVRFDASGTQQLGMIKTAAVPSGIGFALDGSLLVTQGAFVARYDVESGREIGRLSGGQLQNAFGVAVDDQTGFIYVVDTKANQIEIYTADGNFVKAFGKGMRVDANGVTVLNPFGKLSGPSGIAFEKVSRQFAVADTMSNRVQFFDVDGNFVKSIGIPLCGTATTICSSPVQPMQFVMPIAIAFEYANGSAPVLSRMFIADTYTANVQVVDPVTDTALLVAGTAKNTIGAPGMSNGLLMTPTDVVFDSVNKRLLVVDSSIGNVTIYGIDGGTTPAFADTIAPVLTVDPVLTNVNVPSITISGTVEAGSTVYITTDGTTVAGDVVFTSGSTWKSQISGLLPGFNSITVAAKDAAGNTTTPQTITTTYTVAAPKLALSSAVPAQTNIPVLVLSGTTDVDSVVTVSNVTTTVSGAATLVGTEWTYQMVLAEGINEITISAQKPASEKTIIPVTTSLDTISPLLTLSAIADGSNTNTRVQNIAGTVKDENTVTVLINNAAVSVVDKTFTSPVSLVTGANVITVVATDFVGNTTVTKRNINFDELAPVITVAEPMDNSIANSPIVQISGSVDEASTVSVSGLQAVVVDKTWTASVTLIPGLNTIEVVATDLFGNTSMQKRSITLDEVKPVLAIAYPAQDIAVNHNIKIVGTVSDTDAATIDYVINGTVATAPINNGRFSFKVKPVKDGIYPVTVTVSNSAGNSATATRTLIFDTLPPELKVIGISRNDVISGTVEEGSTVEINENNRKIKHVLVRVDGINWSADLSRVGFNRNRITVVAKDAAGNTTSKAIRGRN